METKKNSGDESELELSNLDDQPVPEKDRGPAGRRAGAIAGAVGTMSAGPLGMTAGALIGGGLGEALGQAFDDDDAVETQRRKR